MFAGGSLAPASPDRKTLTGPGPKYIYIYCSAPFSQKRIDPPDAAAADVRARVCGKRERDKQIVTLGRDEDLSCVSSLLLLLLFFFRLKVCCRLPVVRRGAGRYIIIYKS